MALIKDTNSYATVAEADAYFADRLGADVWLTLTPEKKSQALIAATLHVDGLRWKGSAISASQSLAFPRSGYYLDTVVGDAVAMDPVPPRIIKGTFEMALHLINNEGVQEASSTLKSLKVGPIELTDMRDVQKTSPIANNLFRDMLDSRRRTWWRAN